MGSNCDHFGGNVLVCFSLNVDSEVSKFGSGVRVGLVLEGLAGSGDFSIDVADSFAKYAVAVRGPVPIYVFLDGFGGLLDGLREIDRIKFSWRRGFEVELSCSVMDVGVGIADGLLGGIGNGVNEGKAGPVAELG